MNNKKFIVSLASVFAITYIIDLFMNNSFLRTAYEQTQSLWRPENEIMSMWHLCVIVHLIFAIIIVQFFKNFVFISEKKHTLHDSLGAGLLIGELVGLIQLSSYIFMPIPPSIAIVWFTSMVIKCVGAAYVLWVIDQRIK
jgi:hypothetical protein